MAQKNYKPIFEKLLPGFLMEDDPIKAVVEWVFNQLMEIEAEAKVGAPKGKHSRERRTYFSGVRVRKLPTRVGTLYLVIPKVRKGGYIPIFLTERKRSEVALISLVQEAFINGVSTRKIERLARALGIEGVSASQVSEMTRGLDERVKEFRSSALSEEYPFVWIDAIYEKLKQIWLQPDRESAEKLASLIIEEYEKNYPETMRCLEEGLEDSLQFYNFPEIDKRRISSTNVLERTNRKIRRKSRVVGVFPSVDFYLRLVVSYLMEATEDWANDNVYIKAEKLRRF